GCDTTHQPAQLHLPRVPNLVFLRRILRKALHHGRGIFRILLCPHSLRHLAEPIQGECQGFDSGRSNPRAGGGSKVKKLRRGRHATTLERPRTRESLASERTPNRPKYDLPHPLTGCDAG
ncbi:hypothetical protein M427DRAFT_159090, partial [Gonapodya prolifera JEL478]